jgi:hypothetical protein
MLRVIAPTIPSEQGVNFWREVAERIWLWMLGTRSD